MHWSDHPAFETARLVPDEPEDPDLDIERGWWPERAMGRPRPGRYTLQWTDGADGWYTYYFLEDARG